MNCRGLAWTAVALVTAARSSTAQTAGMAVLRSDNVYARGTAECPGAVVAANGDIIVTFTNHGDVQPGTDTLFIRSSDGGKTWSEVYLKLSAENPKENGVSVGGLLRCSGGALLAARVEIHMPDAKLYLHQTAAIDILESSDDGRTFAKVSALRFPPGTLAAPYGPMVALADGSILMPGFIENHGNGYWQSRDQGRTWSDFRVVWNDPPAGVKGKLSFNETAYVELADRSLYALARNDVNDLFYASTSSDHGVTWTEPKATPLAGGSPALLRTAAGSLLLAYRDAGRPGLAVCESSDGGRNWRYLFALPVPEGVPALPQGPWRRPALDQAWQPGEGHVGYPALVAMPDDQVYAVWHVHNIHSPPAAPGRDTYGLVGNLLGATPEAPVTVGAQVFPLSQIGAILRAQAISGAGAAAALVDPSGIPGLTVTPLRIENRTSNDAEVHQAEDDIFYVLDGAATFYLGGTLHDTWTYSPGNQAGHEQRGASATAVAAGDVVLVPRGTVHRISCPGGFVELLVVKRSER